MNQKTLEDLHKKKLGKVPKFLACCLSLGEELIITCDRNRCSISSEKSGNATKRKKCSYEEERHNHHWTYWICNHPLAAEYICLKEYFEKKASQQESDH